MPTPLEVIAAVMDDDLMMYQADYQNAQTILDALEAAGYKVIKLTEENRQSFIISEEH